MKTGALTDHRGRSFRYLRLSVTGACNFRCIYCLPNGYVRPVDAAPALGDPLDLDEIARLVGGFASVGFTKVRLTGGEPTVRRDIVEIVRRVAGTRGVGKVGLTTNGFRLRSLALPLRRAGLSGLNVSIDSLDPGLFKRITGRDALRGVLAGIDAALEAGFREIKVNVVLLRDLNLPEVDAFVDWTRGMPVHVRFIELMRTGSNGDLFRSSHVSASAVQLRLLKEGWRRSPRDSDSGPSVDFERDGHVGKVGLIAPYAQGFCDGCNRLRVTSTGNLRLCLFGERDYPLRNLVGEEDGAAERVGSALRAVIERKPDSHYLHEGEYGNAWNLSAIGG